jgi:hypothetical protein
LLGWCMTTPDPIPTFADAAPATPIIRTASKIDRVRRIYKII